MAVSRTPGDTGDIYRRQLVFRGSTTSQWYPGDKPKDAVITPSSRFQNVEKSSRSGYAMGQTISISGQQFKKATAYAISSVRLEASGAYNCNHFYRHPSGTYFQQTALMDTGWEMGYMLSSGFASSNANASIPTDMRNEAITEALNELASQQVNLGENLATLQQTIAMFKSKSDLLSAALHAGKNRRDWRKFLRRSARQLSRKGSVETAAQEYLTYVYGLKPLVIDVYNAAETCKELMNGALLLNGRGKAIRSFPVSPLATRKIVGATADAYRRGGSCEKVVRASIWARLDPDAAGLRALNQVGLLNPLSLFWELVPWSFVVDWFIPIGPVFNALSARVGLIFVDGSISCKCSEDVHYDYRPTQGSHLHTTSDPDPLMKSQLMVTRKFEGYNREIIPAFPFPGYWVDSDPLRGDRGYKATALSIVSLKR